MTTLAPLGGHMTTLTCHYKNGRRVWKRKHVWVSTGHDWVIFDENDKITGRAHSLTWAKIEAAE